jgi:hypothetical protein
MSFGKDKLSYDPTDADTIAASDLVGAIVRVAAGTDITHTTVGAKEALDVYVANGISVDLNGVYNVGTNPTPDTTGMIAHVRAAAPDQTNQTFRSTGGAASSDDVTAGNVFGLDVNAFGMVFDGTNWDRLRGTSGAVHINDGGNSITVDGTVTALQGTSPWVIGDGGGSITVDGSVSITGTVAVTQSTSPWVVSDAALANTALASSANSIADTAEDIKGTAALANRKYLWAQNLGPNNVYFGASGVTATTGLRLASGALIEMRLGPAVMPQAITAGVGQTGDLRLLEAS